MRSLLLIILIYFSGFGLRAQTNLDSLFTVWEDETETDTTRVFAFQQYIWDGYLFSRPDTVEEMAEALHAFANKHGYSEASGIGYNLQGIANKMQGNAPRALYYYKKALALGEELGNKYGIASILSEIGGVYSDHGNYPLALKYYQKSLAIDEELGDTINSAYAIGNIGAVYLSQGNYSRALEHFQKSLENLEDFGDKYGIATTQINIGLSYDEKGDYPLALEYYQKSRLIYEEIGDKYGIANNRNHLGSLYQRQGKNSLAQDYCQRGLVLAQEIGSLVLQEAACQCLYDSYKAVGEGNKALLYLEKMNAINDSLHEEETAKQLQQMEFEKEVLADSLANIEEARLIEEAHKEEVRKKNRTRNLLAGGGVLLLLLAGGFYSRWRYVHKAKNIIEEEKDRSNNLLLNILPADIAEELKIHGKAEARDFDMVSMLFTDFKGFTAASAKLSASELVTEINACFEAFDGIMEKFGVEKIKTIGDAYMAAGGLPLPTDDSTKNTVLAALEMQDFIIKRKLDLDTKGLPGFEMRVGIHTGPVVAGIVGVKKFQYDIWGDTVNTASRMESNGQVGKVNISQTIYDLLKDDQDFSFQSRGKIEAKGKGAIEMYFVSKA